jgi:hypothetical protein
MNYIIKETQNVNSDRKGVRYNGTLSAAKRFGSNNQAFCGTTLKIENECGTLIAYKREGRWHSQ